MYSDICQEDYTLFDYQSQSKRQIFSSWDSINSVMFQMPTGTGKTRLFTSIVRDILKWGNYTGSRVKILVIAHRKELIDQISDCLSRYQICHSKIVGGLEKDLSQNVLVASIQTLSQSKQREKYRDVQPNFVIIDEAHHSIAPSYKRLWELFPDAKFLGVTATPWSMSQTGFDTIYEDIILSLQPKEFIKINRLAPYDYYSIKDSNDIYQKVHSIHKYDHDGDFTKTALERTFDNVLIRAKLLDSYLKYAKGKKGIIYSICRAHSKHICEEYEKAGIKITDIDGETPLYERQWKVNEFKNGNIDIIVNVDIFSEGFDCPDIEFIQLARPTKSLVKYLQQVGRGLRVSNKKSKCIILDNVGALYDFGLPDIDRNWVQYFHGKQQIEHEDIRIENSNNTETKKKKINMNEGHEEMFKIVSYDQENTLSSNSSNIHSQSAIESLIESNRKNFLKIYEKRTKR